MSRWIIGARPPLHVALELANAGHHAAVASDGHTTEPDEWLNLTSTDPHRRRPPSIVRIQAPDLAAAQQQTARIRAAATGEGYDSSDVIVLVDVEVMVAYDAPTARRELTRLDGHLTAPSVPASLRYVGTPNGLAGLVADIHAVHVADGVTLRPLINSEVLAHIAFRTLPWLESIGVPLSPQQVAAVRRRALRSGAGRCADNRQPA
ncbi:hypothetical protein [Nocardia nova]|uniref:hypothetical protein n=1 Tax=Nocardia nova TaxID=37330 RepID=UPI0007C82F6B|nr:hypothetical protein [Nocardia nova]MBV7707040.1 hypothetical protein [Nocardia nova]